MFSSKTVLTSVAFCLTMCLSSPLAHAWVTEELDMLDAGNVAKTFVGVDGEDHIHITLLDQDTDTVKYVTNASGDWVISEILTLTYPFHQFSMAVDYSGNVHVAFQYGIYSGIEYLTNASGYWDREQIAYPTGYHANLKPPSIAVDGFGRVHVSYAGETDWPELWYATNASGSWVSSEVFPVLDLGGANVIAADNDGHAHIVSTGLYFTNASGSWAFFPALVAGQSIALSSSGTVYTSLTGLGDILGELYVFMGRGLLWTSVCVDCSGDVGLHSSIALDASDRAIVSYYDETDNQLKVAFQSGLGWAKETACNRPSGSGQDSSIAVASTGMVYISHHGDDGTLLLTSGTPSPQEAETGWGAAVAQASTYGADSLVGSGIFNELSMLLVPGGVVFLLRILRRRK